MTRAAFLAAYRAELLRVYTWAQNTAKLDAFMGEVEATLIGPRNPWHHEGAAVTAAWRNIGGKGKPTKKALRELP